MGTRARTAGRFAASMAKNIIVISCDIRETRVALIEDGIIAELHLARKGNRSAGRVGSVVLGKVTRVLPGLQAAFVEVGQERAAFLHVEDLIRPDDFETYLAGGRKHAMNEDGPAADEVREEGAGGRSRSPHAGGRSPGRGAARQAEPRRGPGRSGGSRRRRGRSGRRRRVGRGRDRPGGARLRVEGDRGGGAHQRQRAREPGPGSRVRRRGCRGGSPPRRRPCS